MSKPLLRGLPLSLSRAFLRTIPLVGATSLTPGASGRLKILRRIVHFEFLLLRLTTVKALRSFRSRGTLDRNFVYILPLMVFIINQILKRRTKSRRLNNPALFVKFSKRQGQRFSSNFDIPRQGRLLCLTALVA